MPDQTLTTPPTTDRLGAFTSPLAVPAVVHLDGVDIVVLTATGRTDVSVWAAGAVCHLPAGTPVVPVTDPARQGTVLRLALASLNRLRQQAEEALWTQRNHHMSTLDEVRSYAIEAHVAGDICRDGLNAFLCAFNMTEYRPRVRVAYTLGGTFTVTAQRDDHVIANAVDVLRPDFAEVDDVESATAEHEIMLRLVTPTTLEDGCGGFTVTYAINGSYVVDHDDPDEAETDCVGYLRPDLNGIEGLVPDTASFTVESVTTDYDD
ncbi:hypothetical protein AB0A74_09540 [Saccharothrix sp. NPDC042600]|uniref:hypothetical protein n=1 Tax=Saccharothrix TaxID=2071 RepID=UPI0033C1D96E|nr:hypothetical protein GCM10017745_35380 [Saccharothrix mutabilis subsp. capreolus]